MPRMFANLWMMLIMAKFFHMNLIKNWPEGGQDVLKPKLDSKLFDITRNVLFGYEHTLMDK